MVFNIVLNSSNVVGTSKTLYSKDFIGGSLTIPPGSQLAISQVVFPYSWFNITSNYNNNKLSYIWNGYYPSVIWNGSMSGTVFTGTADAGSSGSFTAGQLVVSPYLTAGTTVSSSTSTTVTLSATYSGTAPTVITGIPTFTGYITYTNSVAYLTLSSVVSGTFALNAILYSSNTSLDDNVYASSLYSGTLGAVGSVYVLSGQTVAVGSSSSTFKFGFVGTYNTITFPDGFYFTSDINSYIQQYMLSQKQYIYNSTLLQNVFFSKLYLNSNYYGNQFLLYSIPSSQTDYNNDNTSYSFTYPTGFPFSALGNTPQMVIYDGMCDYLGYMENTYPSTPQSSSYTITSNTTPNATTVNSILVRCNLVSNSATSPSDILDTFSINTTFGSNITYEPPYEKWIDVVEGTYSNLYIQFQDQNGNTIYANDDNCMISLLLKFGYVAPNLPPPVPILPPPKVVTLDTLDFKE